MRAKSAVTGMTGMTGMTAVRIVYLVGFLEGTGAHVMYVVDGGLHAFRGFPLPSQVFLHLLLVLDPLVAYLVWRRRPAAPILAAAVMFGDLLANWQGNWAYVQTHPSILLRPYGLPVLTLFGLFVFATAVPLRHALPGARPIPDATHAAPRTAQ